MKAYRIVARIKNNRLWATILARWPDVRNQADAARRLRSTPQELGKLLNMHEWPHRRDGQWTVSAERIARRLRETPDFLFDGALYGIRPQKVELEVDRPALEATGMLALPEAERPDAVLERSEGRRALAAAIETLTPREAGILKKRFGLEDGREWTLEAIGRTQAVTRDRIRQIEAKALRKLRHPSRVRALRELIER